MFVFTPVIWIIDNISGFFLRLIGIKDDSADGKITEDELRTIVKVSHEEGVIESDERKIIYNLFDFGDTTAKDVMIPRIDMELVDVNASYEEVLEVFRETQYTRLPVYEKDSDNIIGILNIKDLIITPQNGEFNIRNIMRDVRYTFEQKNTSELFREMQVNSTSIVIVLDEYGSTVGMITTEDLLEEIVGEIRDEYDTDEREGIYKIRGNTYRVDASFKLDDLNDYLNLHLESEDNDSIGGLILEKLDRIPKAGDKLTIDNVWLFIEKASTKRAESIILKLLDTTKNEDSKDNQ
jgi:CBS domain containing-hemolysin-like protein